jgi:hypothetical protein
VPVNPFSIKSRDIDRDQETAPDRQFAIIQAVKRVEAKGFRCVSMTFSDGNRSVTASINVIRSWPTP